MSGTVVLPEKTDAVTENPQVKQVGAWKRGFRLPGKCSVVERAAVLWSEWGGAPWLQMTLNDLSKVTQKSQCLGTGLCSYLLHKGEYLDNSPISPFSFPLSQIWLCCGFFQCIQTLLLCFRFFLQLFWLSLLIIVQIRSTQGANIWAFNAVLLSNVLQLVVLLLSLHSLVCGDVHSPACTQWMIYHVLSVGLCTVSRDNVFFHLVPSWRNTLPYGFHMWFS